VDWREHQQQQGGEKRDLKDDSWTSETAGEISKIKLRKEQVKTRDAKAGVKRFRQCGFEAVGGNEREKLR